MTKPDTAAAALGDSVELEASLPQGMIVIMDVYECKQCDTHYAIENGKASHDCPFCLHDATHYVKIKQIEIDV